MRLPNKTEIINACIVLLIVLIPYLDKENELMKKIILFTNGILAIRFLYPINLIKATYIDFSKILNVIIWTFIALLLYYTDKTFLVENIFSVSNGLLLIIIFTYFISMRGIYYWVYKIEPAWCSKYARLGDYDDCLDRKINKNDRTFTWIYFGVLFLGILIMINI